MEKKDNNEEIRKKAVGSKGKVATEKVATEQKEEKQKPASNAEKNSSDFSIKDGKVIVISESRAGKSIYATTGNLITFSEKGIAEVDVLDALYLKNCNGITLAK